MFNVTYTTNRFEKIIMTWNPTVVCPKKTQKNEREKGGVPT